MKYFVYLMKTVEYFSVCGKDIHILRDWNHIQFYGIIRNFA